MEYPSGKIIKAKTISTIERKGSLCPTAFYKISFLHYHKEVKLVGSLTIFRDIFMKNLLLTLSFTTLACTPAFAIESLPVLTSEHKQELSAYYWHLNCHLCVREIGLMVSDWDQWANELGHNIPQLKHDLIDLYNQAS